MLRLRCALRALAWWGALLLSLTLVSRAVVLEPFRVESGSMAPTLAPGDRVWVEKMAPGQVERGEIVAFDGSDTLAVLSGREAHPSWLGRLTGDRRVVYVKRVVAVGGDRLRCCLPDGRLELNGVPLDEPYVAGHPAAEPFDVTVPAGRFWAMGDHRDDSRDSRSLLGAPGGGMLRLDRVVGRVILVPDRRG